jgi:hypothetical protein
MREDPTIDIAANDATRTEAMAPARLVCLGPPRLEFFGASHPLDARHDQEPVEVLLRIAAAGPPGVAVDALCAAIWPSLAERARRIRLGDCRRCLALLLGDTTSPVSVDGGHASIDAGRLAVDSLELESAIEPVLDPFERASEAATERARVALSDALARHAVFLPGLDRPWANVARLRIGDKLVRAARRFWSE